MPNLQAAVCALIQEQEHAGLQVICSLTLFYIISTLDTYFRRLHLRQVVNQLGWNRTKLLVGGLVGFCGQLSSNSASCHCNLSKLSLF